MFEWISPVDYWPHLILILVASFVGAKAKHIGAAIGVGLASTVIAVGVYTLIDPVPWPLGLYSAEFLSGMLPLLGAALGSHVLGSWIRPAAARTFCGTMLGMVLLLPVPEIGLRLACVFQDVCL